MDDDIVDAHSRLLMLRGLPSGTTIMKATCLQWLRLYPYQKPAACEYFARYRHVLLPLHSQGHFVLIWLILSDSWRRNQTAQIFPLEGRAAGISVDTCRIIGLDSIQRHSYIRELLPTVYNVFGLDAQTSTFEMHSGTPQQPTATKECGPLSCYNASRVVLLLRALDNGNRHSLFPLPSWGQNKEQDVLGNMVELQERCAAIRHWLYEQLLTIVDK